MMEKCVNFSIHDSLVYISQRLRSRFCQSPKRPNEFETYEWCIGSLAQPGLQTIMRICNILNSLYLFTPLSHSEHVIIAHIHSF